MHKLAKSRILFIVTPGAIIIKSALGLLDMANLIVGEFVCNIFAKKIRIVVKLDNTFIYD